ncbi:uncharacterized protein F4807DRAFT_423609 [Annulohypoxylon truncatum]|uniref:uncharacterized protein n=1 Tax=Annulohypoxylon truncatum TaxID=327061 RepID=UPI002007F9CA|nr:uncharacterized protein F4807DRAFT_423609 [Annulohypoxylon truncatum]KAI1210498.1 hypothetical protein F4807DRAFT_423609 [Annulohypoxylon truncatum]
MGPIHWSVLVLCSAKYAIGLRIPQETGQPSPTQVQYTTSTVLRQRDCFDIGSNAFGGSADCVSLGNPILVSIPITAQVLTDSIPTTTVQTLPPCSHLDFGEGIGQTGGATTVTGSGCQGFPTDQSVAFVLDTAS